MSLRLRVRLTPRASADRIDGWTADASGHPVLKARTTAPPADGRANEALVRMIARAAGVAPTRVTIASGASSRLKTLQIAGGDEAQILARLGAPP